MKRSVILAVIIALGIVGVFAMQSDAEKALKAIDAALLLEEEAMIEAPPADIHTDAPIILPTVTFSHSGTFYDRSIFVELFSDDPDAVIYYTLDGSNPLEKPPVCYPDGFSTVEYPLYCAQHSYRLSHNRHGCVPACSAHPDESPFDDDTLYCHLVGVYFAGRNVPPEPLTIQYRDPIFIVAGADAAVVTVKAVAVSGDEMSEVVTKSYIVGNNVWERFTPDTYVFVLSTDPYNFFCHYHGTHVRGFWREQFRAEGGSVGQDPTILTNFNMRGLAAERPVFVEVFDSSGNTLISQAAGTRVAGGWSRDENRKSFRLIARNEYSEGFGKFRYPFFNDNFNIDGQLVTRFDRITLRNGGNDRDGAGLRDELVQRLAAQAGFSDTQSSAPAAVFLNNEYYGFKWLKEAYTSGHLALRYGGNKENYRIIDYYERALYCLGEDGRSTWDCPGCEECEEQAVRDWHYLFRLAERAITEEDGSLYSFNNDEIFEDFISRVDIDNLMLYYAIQIYVDNRDWPNNNMRMWRYYPDEDEIITNAYNDGRFRFLMFDIEFALGIYNNGPRSRTLRNVTMSGRSTSHMGGTSTLLRALIQREDMREKFANTICDLIDGAYSPENMVAVMEELIALMNDEHMRDLDDHAREPTKGIYGSWVSRWTVEENRDNIREFARRRPQVVLDDIVGVFELPDGDMFNITLNSATGADVWLNTRRVTEGCEPVTTSYFVHFGVSLKAELYEGYEFEAWEVNGVLFDEPDFKVTAALADSNGNITVNLITNKLIEGLPLYIQQLCTASGADWITLYNPNHVAISTRAYYLSDNIENLKRWKIPAIIVQPQESLTIVMRNNSSPDIIMKPQTNFSLSTGETLFLSDTNGNIIGRVEIREMNRGETLERQRDGTYSIIAQ